MKSNGSTAAQPPNEAVQSALYMLEYFDCVDNMPLDVMRGVSSIRDYNVEIQTVLRDLEESSSKMKHPNASLRRRAVRESQRLLLDLQDLNDQKLQVVQTDMLDVLDRKQRSLDKTRRDWGE
jgi:hypothetical protein